MATWPNKQIIYSRQTLAIVQSCFRHRHIGYRPLPRKHLRHDTVQIGQREWQQHALPSPDIRIDTNEQLTVKVLKDICHQTILPNGNYGIHWPKDKVWDKCTIHNLDATMMGKNVLRIPDGLFVDLILPLIIGEVRPQMLDVEPRLILGVKPGSQLI